MYQPLRAVRTRRGRKETFLVSNVRFGGDGGFDAWQIVAPLRDVRRWSGCVRGRGVLIKVANMAVVTGCCS